MSEAMNDPRGSQSITYVAEETTTPKIQEPGKTIPSAAYQPIPPKNLGIKIRTQPDNEDEINIESVPIHNVLISIIRLTECLKILVFWLCLA